MSKSQSQKRRQRREKSRENGLQRKRRRREKSRVQARSRTNNQWHNEELRKRVEKTRPPQVKSAVISRVEQAQDVATVEAWQPGPNMVRTDTPTPEVKSEPEAYEVKSEPENATDKEPQEAKPDRAEAPAPGLMQRIKGAVFGE